MFTVSVCTMHVYTLLLILLILLKHGHSELIMYKEYVSYSDISTSTTWIIGAEHATRPPAIANPNFYKSVWPTTWDSSVFGMIYGLTWSRTLVLCSKAYAYPISSASLQAFPRKLIPKLDISNQGVSVKMSSSKALSSCLMMGQNQNLRDIRTALD